MGTSMASIIAVVMALFIAYMLAFTTIKRDSVILLLILFLIGAYLAGI